MCVRCLKFLRHDWMVLNIIVCCYRRGRRARFGVLTHVVVFKVLARPFCAGSQVSQHRYASRSLFLCISRVFSSKLQEYRFARIKCRECRVFGERAIVRRWSARAIQKYAIVCGGVFTLSAHRVTRTLVLSVRGQIFSRRKKRVGMKDASCVERVGSASPREGSTRIEQRFSTQFDRRVHERNDDGARGRCGQNGGSTGGA